MRTSSLLFYRYFLFGLLIVCNAIICSAAVWSLSNARIAGFTTHIDAFMIFLGAFSLVLVLPILFFDVFVRHAWTGWVSTELVWVTALWALHLAGAAAVTAIPEPLMCSTVAKIAVPNSCLSVRLMMVPAWICTLGLFAYVVAFFTAIMIHRRRNDTIWYASVRSYPWYEHLRCQPLKSAPASPTAIVAPKPSRPVQIPSPSALGAELQYEYLNDLPQPPVPAAPAPQTRQVAQAPPSFYPIHMRPFVESEAAPPMPPPVPPPVQPPRMQPPSMQPPIMVVTSLSRPAPSEPRAAPAPSRPADPQGPSPLGDWPRPDIMKQPSPKARAARRKAPPSAEPASVPMPEPHARQPSVSLTTTAERPSLDRSRPTGPRHRSRSSADMPRPPPLDMSRISNMHSRRQSQSGS